MLRHLGKSARAQTATTLDTFVSLLAIAWLSGLLVGMTGVGGILVIPALLFLGGFEVHRATGTALFTFVFLGALGAWLFWREGSIAAATALPVSLGALPFSFVGSFVNSALGSARLHFLVALTITLVGIYTLVPVRRSQEYRDGNSGKDKALLLGIGAASGFGSGLSGAGGPVFAMPMLLISRFDPLASIGASQLLVLTSSASSTLANLRYGSVDFALGLWLTACELVGVTVGASLAHHERVRRHLRVVVALTCVAIGAAMLISR